MLGLEFVRINNPEVLEEFMRRHREATDAVLRWKRRVRSTNWRTPHDALRLVSGGINLGRNRLRFKIMGNRYRLVAKVDYVSGTVEVRFVGTHGQYDDINAQEV